jgi:hypothetical protein
MIGETRYALNYSKLDIQTIIENDGYQSEADISMAPKTTVLGFIAADKS